MIRPWMICPVDDLSVSVTQIFIPKSIENNFPFIDKCIGFDTVVQVPLPSQGGD